MGNKVKRQRTVRTGTAYFPETLRAVLFFRTKLFALLHDAQKGGRNRKIRKSQRFQSTASGINLMPFGARWNSEMTPQAASVVLPQQQPAQNRYARQVCEQYTGMTASSTEEKGIIACSK